MINLQEIQDKNVYGPFNQKIYSEQIIQYLEVTNVINLQEIQDENVYGPFNHKIYSEQIIQYLEVTLLEIEK